MGVRGGFNCERRMSWERTDAGAEVFGGEDLDGEVWVDLADDLASVAVGEVGFLGGVGLFRWSACMALFTCNDEARYGVGML